MMLERVSRARGAIWSGKGALVGDCLRAGASRLSLLQNGTGRPAAASCCPVDGFALTARA